ncbi:hypothetical protein JL722_10823 [Aureococcus anophagefferens]|nr:hypothetical protein JL722_10823 [Aureococcus anophagefferens]
MARRLVAAALLLLIPTRGDDGGRCHIEVVVDGAARRLETSVPPPERPELVAGARDFAEDLGLATGAGCDTDLPRVAASIADAVAPGAADFFFVFGGAGVGAPDAAWRGAFDRFPQIAQFVVDDTGGQLQKLQLCFGHVLAARPPWPTVAMARSLPAQDRAERHLLKGLDLALDLAAEPFSDASPVRSTSSRGRAAPTTRLEAWARAAPKDAAGRLLVDAAPAAPAWDDGSARAARSRRRRRARRGASASRLGDAYAAALRYKTLGCGRRQRAGARAAAPAPPTPPSCARSFAPDVLASPFYFRAAPLMEGVAGCSARHLLARGGDLRGGPIERQ